MCIGRHADLSQDLSRLHQCSVREAVVPMTDLEVLDMSLARCAREVEQIWWVLRVSCLDELHRLRLRDPAFWVCEEQHGYHLLPDAPFGVWRGRTEVYSEGLSNLMVDTILYATYRGENMSMPQAHMRHDHI